ncbi:Transcriptional regulator of nonfermentable carbon utilization [Malassezia yamatoensis]|uniref:Transcriptional regulator of nonfermentable carbon utilization n=1 Tax=Malassezia yamatoensis TaxID=253288 RepID=A0AAJ5YX13_9BASI|nr:Transcriptional regulator of nonfermentable carbon utilization [Malassezia yamatoensis]
MDAPTSSGYDSTWLECSIINSMLHDADSHVLNSESPDVPTAPAMELMDSYTLVNQVFPQEISDDKLIAPSVSWDPPSVIRSSNEAAGLPEIAKPPEYPMNDLASRFENPAFQAMATSSRSPWQSAVSPSQLTQTDHAPSGSNQRQDSTVHPASHATYPDHLWKERVAKVYREDLQPFRYTEGYHILLKYVTQKYEKADVLRIVRALAIFRPSLIALQMALSEEDEKFVERAFQRTMLEFEKLISFSGTPTVVWRRTCEICVVGAEFCMLTQWSKENLLGQYMYQLMDKDSVLRYWYVYKPDQGSNSPVMRLRIRHRR